MEEQEYEQAKEQIEKKYAYWKVGAPTIICEVIGCIYAISMPAFISHIPSHIPSHIQKVKSEYNKVVNDLNAINSYSNAFKDIENKYRVTIRLNELETRLRSDSLRLANGPEMTQYNKISRIEGHHMFGGSIFMFLSAVAGIAGIFKMRNKKNKKLTELEMATK